MVLDVFPPIVELISLMFTLFILKMLLVFKPSVDRFLKTQRWSPSL